MGSGGETVRETVASLNARGERVGVAQVRLYRPFPAQALAEALPATVRRIAVLDRTKEPGSIGEPLFLDTVAALTESSADGERAVMPRVVGGRYGLSSKEFTPGMVAGVFDELAGERPRRRFTIGITDDVSGTSLTYDAGLDIEPPETVRAIFFGLGSDGTVGANKNTIKILGAEEGLHAQGYFVYDSKKSGSQTVSHLRFGPQPIRAPYLVQQAGFVGCHQFGLLERADVLGRAADGATLLLNCPRPADEVWDALSRPVQEQILAKHIDVYVIDAGRIAREVGLAGRINIVLQTCFFAVSGVLPREQAIERIKAAVAKTYGRRGAEVVERNQAAVDRALEGLHRVEVPERVTATRGLPPVVPAHAPEFVRTVTAEMLAGRGDDLPVSALPVDGTYPSGTAAYEKRNISELVAVWDSELCIQCGNCSFVCPHSVIRSRYYDQSHLEGAPDGFQSAPLEAVGLPDTRYTLQVYVEDCTGCELCVEACPVVAPGDPVRKAINLAPREPLVAAERDNIAFFETLPASDRSRVDFGTVRGTQFLEPLFEFSGACAGCGETPYLKLLSQLFGDRLMVANATGCSSIYGGNLPTTPWTTDADGRGPAWSNSLFEDNAEFGLGFRLAADRHTDLARRRLAELRDAVGAELVDEILDAPQLRESELRAQRERVAELKRRLDGLEGAAVTDLLSVVDHLVRRSVWIVGGDGWAYDIGSGGLDHVLASGRNVNVLVLDTEVYSNTGGQMSKATPLGAVAKFAAAGKTVPKKDLALQAIAYGNVYVARVAMGADPQQTLSAFREAEAYDGPSLVLAYSHCIAHGIDMRNGLDQQYRAVASGYWPLIRYDPMVRAAGGNPFLLDSPRPRIPLADYTDRELRYRTLTNTDPAEAERLHGLAEEAVDQRWDVYEEMATRGARALRRRRAQGSLMDLSTGYMGLALRNPLVASASPLSQTVDGVRRLADAGVGAVVLYSLFEEQLRREAAENARLVDAGTESFAESLSYFPAAAEDEAGPRRYLSLLERAAAAVDVPVIGSLNGVTPSGWTDYARAMQDAGAAAIELNIYYLPGDPHVSGRDVEQRHVDILTAGQGRGQRAGGGQAEPVLQLDRRDGAAAGRGGRRRAGALQPVPATRHRPRDSRRGAPDPALPARPRRGCRARGSRSCTDACRPRSRRPPASRPRPTWPSTSSPAPTS